MVYGRLTFEIARIPSWRRMPKPSTSYTGANKRFTFEQHKDYMSDAAALFPELDVRAHPLLLVVGARTDAIAISPTFIATLASGGFRRRSVRNRSRRSHCCYPTLAKMYGRFRPYMALVAKFLLRPNANLTRKLLVGQSKEFSTNRIGLDRK